MTAVENRPPLYRRPEELGRRVVGSVLEFGIKAYGAAAALSVALSDAETVGGKSYDAVIAVPNLVERYQQAKYVVDHREEIQTGLDYVHDNAPDAEQLGTAARAGSETLGRITTTYGEVTQALDDLASIRPTNVLDTLPRAKEHFESAWAAKPDLQSLEDLADQAQQVTQRLEELNRLNVDFSGMYTNLMSILDNFASDEIAGTFGVMAAAILLAYALSTAAGFWGRRGRPGLLAGALQALGARLFTPWYVRNLEHALGQPLYAVARERIQSDIVANPDEVLDPDALEELERWFVRRLNEKTTASPGG